MSRKGAFSPTFLQRVYRVPDPCDSLEEAARYYHADLAGMSLGQLLVERDRVKLRLTLGSERPEPWLLERFTVLKRRLADAT